MPNFRRQNAKFPQKYIFKYKDRYTYSDEYVYLSIKIENGGQYD